MAEALKEAQHALARGDYPIGCVIVSDKEIIARGQARTRSRKDWVSHAELSALQENSFEVREAVLSGATVEVYTTLEPCLMCMATIIFHRVSRVIYACPDPMVGASTLGYELSPWHEDRRKVEIKGGVGFNEAHALIKQFLTTANKESPWKKNEALFGNLEPPK